MSTDSTAAAQREAFAQLLAVERQVNSGLNWFFLVAALAVINSVLLRTYTDMVFIVGLGASQVVDNFTLALAADADGDTALIIHGVGLALSLALAGVYALAGWLGKRGQRWAVAAGMVFYLLDGLLVLYLGDWYGALFHGWAVVGMFGGLSAMGRLRELRGEG